MILIADSGATKTDWGACSRKSEKVVRFQSLGYNPNYMSKEEIRDDITKSLPSGFPLGEVEEVYFYGAGVTPMHYPMMEEIFRAVFPSVGTVFVAMDLLASARALLGHKAGFAAILGTGTNSCLFDGEEITLNIDSLGFILGDEGSGAYIGKKLIVDYMRGDMPADVFAEVKGLIGKEGEELLDQIYCKPKPNRYCAQFCKWVGDHRHSNPYYHGLMLGSFRDFFQNIVSHYPDYRKYEFNCVGSVAYYYQDLLSQAASAFGMRVGTIIKAPMDSLIKYHTLQI